MKYRVEWLTNLGLIHGIVGEDDVKQYVENIVALGFTPEVTIEDE